MATLTLILGIHRSGTSMLSLGLQAAGVSAGDFQDVLHQPDNPLGYGEHYRIRDFNDRLLARLGTSWDNWGFQASMIDFSHPDYLPCISEGAALLQSVFVGDGPFVLKDPRISSLAPFWERVIPAAGFELRRILILRDPKEVAESQRQRVERRPREFPVIADAEPMAALWTVGMMEILTSLSDDQTMLLRHADLLANPKTTLVAAARFAGAGEECEDAIAAFAEQKVLPSLYRSRVKNGSPKGPWMWAANAVFQSLVALGPLHRLTREEARQAAESKPWIQHMMRGLPAARQSIARMRSLHEEQQSRIGALSALIWELAPFLTQKPRTDLEAVIARAYQLARSRNLSSVGFPEAEDYVPSIPFDIDDKVLQNWLITNLPDFRRAGLIRKPDQKTLGIYSGSAGAPASEIKNQIWYPTEINEGMINNIQSRLPTFLIVGANKAGTSSIYNYCKMHPDIFMSPIKEPMFFTSEHATQNSHTAVKESANLASPYYVTSMEEYAKLFENAENYSARGEASTQYLASYNLAIKNIKPHIPNVKIIACLRNPTERAFSNYLMYVSESLEKRSFESAILDEINRVIMYPGWYLKLGLYHDAIKAYQEAFGKENVLVLFYENLSISPKALMKAIFNFIGVDEGLELDFGFKANTAEERFKKLAVSRPVMTAREREICADFFKNDIEKLKTIVDFGDVSWDPI